jgi:hypothetical protein
MKQPFLVVLMLAGASMIYADPCAPGTLQDYIDLAPGGCAIGVVTFTNFETAPGQNFATPIDPAAVQVTPGGSPSLPRLTFTVDQSADAGELFELFFRFNALASILSGDAMLLGPASATEDGVVIASQDICPGGAFAGSTPLGCPGVPSSLITFAAEFGSSNSDSAQFAPPTNFFDIFVDLVIDGGTSGTAHLESAAVQISAVPEPATVLLVGTFLGGLALRRLRQRS